MKFRSRISEMTGIDEKKLPSSFQIIGDIILVKFLKLNDDEKKIAAIALKKLFNHVKTVCEIHGVSGELRKPSLDVLYGDSTVTIHKESGILFKIDVSKVMFSKGNHFERQRLLDKVKNDDVVIDMFAGIGYFSLPLAKKCKHVYAIEKNPVSFRFLEENIKLNRLSNITPINDDCRNVNIDVGSNNVHVIMGYFPHTEKYLEKALSFAKKSGVLHYHNTYLEKDLWDKPIKEIKDACMKYGKKIMRMDKRKVKSIAPRVYHVVLDVLVSS